MLARRTVLLLPLLATACVDNPTPGNFSQSNYSYLTKLRLNVANIEIDDRSPPATSALDGMAPLRPADALKQMAMDRLFAGGSAGRAVFVIDGASLTRTDGGIDGRLAVHLDIYTGGETRVGFAEAQVARRRVSTDGETTRTILYEFVNQMMDDMNVEFEFQVRRSLKEYLQDTDSTAPPPAPVQSQDLSAPAAVARPAVPGPARVLVRP